ncbi:hypothetical protein JOF28_001955 [Leucobacter exalbidus]|uniref:Uncharacterized protein n=1 Tax=Leucobacter exalbidus TaxID=662960 RepID=A0A940PP28_9MICO|nr:hypothetical protein [Leucobacter exalbidus]MBP1326723.1 hypothetical protein [Leucobacter exalbidus]
MTTKIRANVTKINGWWLTLAYVTGENLVPSQHAWSKSHPEAMQAAHMLISDFNARLMDAVNESRARRRKEFTA